MEEEGEEMRVQQSSSEESKVKLILNKGWWLGKKIAIAGVAVSSAPFVLPPLVIFSTLGFAFSVPFGLVFASYACTDKIMSKFFPMPLSHPLLEYKTCYEEESEEEEEEEFLEALKQELETRIEMVGDGKSKEDEAELVQENKGTTMGESRDYEDIHIIEQEAKTITETKEVVGLGRNGDIMDSQNLDKIGNERKPTRVVMGESRGKTAEKRDEKHGKARENKLVGESNGERAEKGGEGIMEDTKVSMQKKSRVKILISNVEEGGKSKSKSNMESIKEKSIGDKIFERVSDSATPNVSFKQHDTAEIINSAKGDSRKESIMIPSIE
ncbi:ABC transporter F family member 4-like, partial [Telopea speciosissima]|uniref:ABC transporter F family member 4-like n=1 Tax=Telopea speciosissima TaxID=54955 RepID=UPI001CC64B56